MGYNDVAIIGILLMLFGIMYLECRRQSTIVDVVSVTSGFTIAVIGCVFGIIVG